MSRFAMLLAALEMDDRAARAQEWGNRYFGSNQRRAEKSWRRTDRLRERAQALRRQTNAQ